MSSTSCHTIRASSSTARILSFRPLRTPNRKKHRQVRSTHRAPIRCRCCARRAGRSPRANATAARAHEARAPGSHRGKLRRRELRLGSRRAQHTPRGRPTRRWVLSAGFRTWVGPIVRSPAPAPQVPIVLIATPSNPISPPTGVVRKLIPSRSPGRWRDAVPWPRQAGPTEPVPDASAASERARRPGNRGKPAGLGELPARGTTDGAQSIWEHASRSEGLSSEAWTRRR